MKPLRNNTPGRNGKDAPSPGPRDSAGLIVASLRDGIIYLDETGLVSSLNPVMEELLGVSEEAARGRSIKELTGDPEICLLITLKTGRTTDTFRVKGREFEVDSVEVHTDDGRHAGTVTLFHDVTEVKRLERQRRDVMSMITHDLKTPLTAILGHAELILEGSLGEVSQDVGESVEAIHRGGRKVLSLINDYLTISRLQAGQLIPEFAPTDVGAIAGDVAAVIAPDAMRSGKTVTLRVEPGLPMVECDPAQVERVIANLVNNAVKFTQKKGVIIVGASLADEARAAALTGVRQAENAAYVEIYVEDNGVGIPPEEQPHLFDRFWRGGGAVRVKGTGLGLAIVKSIAEAHHGYAGVKSEPGKGSRFHVLLPVSQTAGKQ